MKLYGIEVTEASDYSINSMKRLDISKFKQFDLSLNGSSMCVQAFIDGLAKHYSMGAGIVRSWADVENKEIIYVKLINSDTTETIRVPFAEAAKKMGWKRFKISDDEQTVIPTK